MKSTDNMIDELKMLLRHEIAKLEKQCAAQKENDQLKRNPLWLQQIADSIIAASNEIAPFARICEIKNIHTGNIEKINLNPKLTIEENAALFIKKAKKASVEIASKEKELAIQSGKLQKLQLSLKKLLSIRDQCDNNDETYFSIIEETKKTLYEVSPKTHQKHQSPDNLVQPDLPFRHYRINDWDIYAGRSDEQNDELSIRFAHHDDIWFHVAGFAGSHVIIRRLKGTPPPDTSVMKAAASVAAWFSKAKNAPSAEVHYTEGRFVHKRKNAPHGEVILEKFKSIKVNPQSPEILFGNRSDAD